MKNETQENINVRVPQEVKQALNDKAKEENRSLSNYLRMFFLTLVGGNKDGKE